MHTNTESAMATPPSNIPAALEESIWAKPIDMTITHEQRERVRREWDAIAGERMRYEMTSSTEPIYAFGSELACLRIEHAMKAGKAAFSPNLKTWYYVNQA